MTFDEVERTKTPYKVLTPGVYSDIAAWLLVALATDECGRYYARDYSLHHVAQIVAERRQATQP